MSEENRKKQYNHTQYEDIESQKYSAPVFFYKENLRNQNSNNNNHHKHQRKTLVLDLDETLVHSKFHFDPSFQADLAMRIPNNDSLDIAYVKLRPFLIYFLKQMRKYYELTIFTASRREYAEPLINYLDTEGLISNKLYRDTCIRSDSEKSFVKDLTQLNRSLSQVILIDNNKDSYKLQEENGLIIKDFTQDTQDRELLNLLPFLEFLSYVLDVRNVSEWQNKFDHSEEIRFTNTNNEKKIYRKRTKEILDDESFLDCYDTNALTSPIDFSQFKLTHYKANFLQLTQSSTRSRSMNNIIQETISICEKKERNNQKENEENQENISDYNQKYQTDKDKDKDNDNDFIMRNDKNQRKEKKQKFPSQFQDTLEKQRLSLENNQIKLPLDKQRISLGNLNYNSPISSK